MLHIRESKLDGLIFLCYMSKELKANESLFKYDDIIPSNGEKYLKHILSDSHYKKWFNQVNGVGKIFVLNKGRCGNGGTTGFIKYAQKHNLGLIVSVPNRSIVISKENDFGDEIGSGYGGSESNLSNKNIRVCTWDKTEEVECVNLGMTMIELDDFFDDDFSDGGSPLLIIDEYHKLIDDSNYRDICYDMVERIMTTNRNVLLMSATPNFEFIDFLHQYSGKEVETYNVEYDDEGFDKCSVVCQWMDRPEDVRTYDIVCEIINSAREKRLAFEENSSNTSNAVNQVIFFYNSVCEISNIVNALPDDSDVEVLCAKTEKNELKCPCYSEQFDENKLIHFMTSACFVGMDADSLIDKIVFIGGNSQFYLSYSNKEIKQGKGRARNGCNGMYIISNGRAANTHKYSDFIGKRDATLETVNKHQKYIGDSKHISTFMSEIVKCNLDYLYYNKVIESMEGWKDGESFKNMMSVYPEYTVKIVDMPKPKTYKRKRDISFKKYKEKRLKGEKVAYKYAAVCEKFIEMFGIDEFAKATRVDVINKVDMVLDFGDVEISSMTPEEKFIYLLGDDRYTGRELMDVLEFIGAAPIDENGRRNYGVLEETMEGAFGCMCIYESGAISKGSAYYRCLLPVEDTVACSTKLGHALINKAVSQDGGTHHLKPIKVSKKISKPDKKTEAITSHLDTMDFYSLLNNGDRQRELFEKILNDPSIIPALKADPEWKKIFEKDKKKKGLFAYAKYCQTMISECYKDTPDSEVKYSHKIEEMDKIDSLIVDIDDSISFNEFKELYSNIEWTAYPTISNYDADNWRKFRVIIPLAQTLLIPNDSMTVVKYLRRMVCKYEDKNHNLGSSVNAEQWAMRRVNNGERKYISQGIVIYLSAYFKSMGESYDKLKRIKKDVAVITSEERLEASNAAIERAIKMINECQEGSRHATIYGQMRRLMTTYRVNDEQIDYIRQQIKDDHDKLKEFNEQVKDIAKRYRKK